MLLWKEPTFEWEKRCRNMRNGTGMLEYVLKGREYIGDGILSWVTEGLFGAGIIRDGKTNILHAFLDASTSTRDLQPDR